MNFEEFKQQVMEDLPGGSSRKTIRLATVEVLEHNKKDLERLLHNEKSAREKQEQQQTKKRNRNGQD